MEKEGFDFDFSENPSASSAVPKTKHLTRESDEGFDFSENPSASSALLKTNIRKYLTQESIEPLAEQANLSTRSREELIKKIIHHIDILENRIGGNVKGLQNALFYDNDLKGCYSIIRLLPTTFPDLLNTIPKLGLICGTIAKIFGEEKAFENELMHAASSCDVKAISQIISQMKVKFIDLDIYTVRNSRGETLLMLAAAGTRMIPHGQSHSAVKLLLEQGADPLATSNDGRTALMEAANFGRVSVVTLLIENVPLDKRIEYIKQCDNTKGSANEMNAYKYAGQLGHYITVHNDVCDALGKSINKTEAEMQAASQAIRLSSFKL